MWQWLTLQCRRTIVRLDRYGNQYIRSVQPPAGMHSSPSSKEHHGSGPFRTSKDSPRVSVSSSPVMEESFFPEDSASLHQHRSSQSTASHDPVSETAQHTRPSVISRVKDLFHLKPASETNAQKMPKTVSNTPAPQKVLACMLAPLRNCKLVWMSSFDWQVTALQPSFPGQGDPNSLKQAQ